MPEVLIASLPILKQEVMPEIASATSMSKTITREPVTFPLEDPQVPEIAPNTTDPNPWTCHELQNAAPTLAGSHKSGYLTYGSYSSQSFAGRVSLFQSNWRILTKDQWVLQIVTEGYHIPLTSDP